MTSHALLFTLAAIGISETAYLINKRWLGEKPVCPIIKSNCHIVLESKYNKLVFSFGNKTFWIHNDVLGLIFYVLVAIITALLYIGIFIGGKGTNEFNEALNNLIKGIIIIGAIMSLYFTYLQWKVIKAWCFWCLMSAMTIFLMTLIVIMINLVTIAVIY